MLKHGSSENKERLGSLLSWKVHLESLRKAMHLLLTDIEV